MRRGHGVHVTVTQQHFVTPGAPLFLVQLRGDPDFVFLQRHARRTAQQLGLPERPANSLAEAAYEGARLLFTVSRDAEASISLAPSNELQITISVARPEGADLTAMLAGRIEQLRPAVDRLSVAQTPGSFSLLLAMAVPFDVLVDPPSGQEPAADDALKTGAATDAGRSLEVENATLRRSLLQIETEMQETNRGVVAMYADLNDQAERLRNAEERMRVLAISVHDYADQLAAANRAKEDFLATLSHELRTPLNAMLGWTRLLRMGKLDADGMARALETIERNAHAQEQLIADIIDVSRIVTGKLRLDLRPTELEPIIDASVDALRAAAQAKGVHLTSAVVRTGIVMGDPERLQQVIWNLLANAIKFTGAGGQVGISLRAVGSEAEILVTDTGEGIAPSLLPFVFDRFTQGDASLTRSHGGIGLGLSIVRHIVELHGGHVRASSDGQSLGATFSVRLPIQDGPSHSPSGLSESPPDD